MTVADLVVRSARLVTPEGERAGALVVSGGRIVDLLPLDAPVTAAAEHTVAGDLAVLPGIVDTHVHLQDPGRPTWEDAEHGTRAAALGGVTTLVDMPLDCDPVTVDPAALAIKRAALAGRCHVDVGFWGGATATNVGELPGLWAAGVLGFKAFLCETGLPDFLPLDAGSLTTALAVTAGLDAPLLVHGEDGALLSDTGATGPAYQDFLRTRPPETEVSAARMLVAAMARTGGRAHLVHVSAAGVLEVVAAARAAGLPLTAETCPHYLVLAAEDVPDGATPWKAMPPVRDAANADRLWAALRDGVIDAVVSDHSPGDPEGTPVPGDFGLACGGVSSLQLTVPAVWTQARRRGAGLSDLVRWMCEGPARLAGLADKGRLAVGCAADFVVFAPDESFVVDASQLAALQPVTPYDGHRLDGVVRQTWLAGRPVDGGRPRGRLLSGRS